MAATSSSKPRAPSSAGGGAATVCARHGPYLSEIFGNGCFRTGCPLCEAELVEQRSAEEAKHKAEREAEWRRNAFESSGLVGRSASASFANFETMRIAAMRMALDACKAYAEASSTTAWRPLLLLGAPGTGKTHLLAAIGRYVMLERASWCTARLVSAREIVRAVRATWRRSADKTEQDVIDDFAQVGLLLIDEIGGSGDGETASLFDIVDARYQRQRPVAIASNLTLPELKQTLGDRLFDRLRENAKVVVFTWPSHRKGAGA